MQMIGETISVPNRGRISGLWNISMREELLVWVEEV